jgi:hypothetical protein
MKNARYSGQDISGMSSTLLSKYIKLKIYKTTNFPVFYGRESWSIRLREEHRLWVSESRELRRIYGRHRDEVTGVWRKRHKDWLHHLQHSRQISRVIKSRRIRWARIAASMGQKRSVYGDWW